MQKSQKQVPELPVQYEKGAGVERSRSRTITQEQIGGTITTSCGGTRRNRSDVSLTKVKEQVQHYDGTIYEGSICKFNKIQYNILFNIKDRTKLGHFNNDESN